MFGFRDEHTRQESIVAGIIEWLRYRQTTEFGYDAGGIRDPLDGRVIGDHYAHTHFAWACSMLYRTDERNEWLRHASEAVEFHLRTSPDEYPPGDWDYHWDFNNLAFVETYALLRDRLDETTRRRWESGLLAWKTNPHSATNWLAMRALAAFRRGMLLEQPHDLQFARDLLDRILAFQKSDGALDDILDRSRPSQYQAYTACLLHRMRDLAPARVPHAVVHAARWLLALTAPDGDPTALGRGQGQIFGYAAAAYLFRAAASLDSDFAPQYRWAENRILAKLAASQTPEGWIPLVLNDVPVAERAGWYDYHHLTVYNAFAAVWLSLAAEIPPASVEAVPPTPGKRWLPDSRLLSIRDEATFSIWAAGESGHGYAADAGITPHLLDFRGTPVFRYPVGPGPGKYADRVPHPDQTWNLWAPILRVESGEWIGPFAGRGGLRRLDDRRWELTYRRGPYAWVREVVFGEFFLEARDRLVVETDALRHAAVRPANVAVRPGEFRRTGKNAFFREPADGAPEESLGLRLWGDGAEPKNAGTVTAANGRVEILAAETGPTSETRFQGGWRLRKGPTAPGADALPGILCLSWDPWSSVWKRKQRLMFEMARTGRAGKVLYAEPPVSLAAVIERSRRLAGADETSRRHRRALTGKSHPRGSRFHLLTSLLPLPGQRTFPKMAEWNRRFRLRQIRRHCRKLGLKGHVLWLYHPSQMAFLDALGAEAELIVYDWTDDWVAAFPSHLPPEEKRRLAGWQEALLKRADVVFGVSGELCRRAREVQPWVYHLPNATDTEVFTPAEPDSPVPAVFAGAARPYLVYLSQITERVDFELIGELASRHPEWRIFMIGPVVCPEARIDSLRRFPNIRLTGPLPYESAARAVARADVCILPHAVDELTRTLDPIKLYDYLATGVPVVTTGVAMNPALEPFVEIAGGADAFESAVAQALSEPEGARERRREAALAHNWKSRAATALDILGRFF